MEGGWLVVARIGQGRHVRRADEERAVHRGAAEMFRAMAEGGGKRLFAELPPTAQPAAEASTPYDDRVPRDRPAETCVDRRRPVLHTATRVNSGGGTGHGTEPAC